MRGSSPHTRGARADERGHLVVLGIIPAYAGSTKLTIAGLDGKSDHPRIRGEHPLLCRAVLKVIGSSPHTRGALRHTPSSKTWIRIIPAYAGSTTALASQAHSIADHPRIRGEHHHPIPRVSLMNGSSPHTRGAPQFRRRPPRRAGIIPAYAGSTGSSSTQGLSVRDHPRIRGEHHLQTWKGWSGNGSSPHTRGAPRYVDPSTGMSRIIPAYAGSTGDIRFATLAGKDHPRIRGEHRARSTSTAPETGSSPHTRGAHPSMNPSMSHPRIIPAYAGSTTSCSGETMRDGDHPRIRGEHAIGVVHDSSYT